MGPLLRAERKGLATKAAQCKIGEELKVRPEPIRKMKVPVKELNPGKYLLSNTLQGLHKPRQFREGAYLNSSIYNQESKCVWNQQNLVGFPAHKGVSPRKAI